MFKYHRALKTMSSMFFAIKNPFKTICLHFSQLCLPLWIFNKKITDHKKACVHVLNMSNYQNDYLSKWKDIYISDIYENAIFSDNHGNNIWNFLKTQHYLPLPSKAMLKCLKNTPKWSLFNPKQHCSRGKGVVAS
jgi:hypothetical protein